MLAILPCVMTQAVLAVLLQSTAGKLRIIYYGVIYCVKIA